MGKNKHNKGKIKPPDAKGGFRIKDPQTIEMPRLDYPIFCFRHSHKDYGVARCTNDQKIALIHRLEDLSKLTWAEIRVSHRHAMGAEKIPISSLQVRPPAFITGDVEFLLAFRFSGKHPMLVPQTQFILHIIFLDSDFTVYDHE